LTFGSPYLLLTLIGVPIAVAGYWAFERQRARRASSWSRPALLSNIVQEPSRWARHVPVALSLLGVTALLVGFARPQRTVVAAHGNAATVAVVLDVSGSMAAADVTPTRIRAARNVAAMFLRELPARYLAAVLTFGTKVRVVVPPTSDHADAISHLPTAITPKAGTSLGDAITSAIAVVSSTSGGAVSRTNYPGAVLIFSDGAQTAGGSTPFDAGDVAVVEGVPVDTVAVGTPTGTVTQPLSVDGFNTSEQYPVPVDPAALASVTQLAHGTSYALDSAAQAPALAKRLRTVYEQLGAPPRRVTRKQQLSAAFAAAALALVAAGIATSAFWFGRAA
jgi:Ca-activated chloride channel family protein